MTRAGVPGQRGLLRVSNRDQRPARALALTAAAFQMAVAMGICAWGGYYLDGRWGTEPWLTILGLILGPIVGLMSISRMLRQVGGSQ
jgi:F0F1-type ATP synthase assembly protein I